VCITETGNLILPHIFATGITRRPVMSSLNRRAFLASAAGAGMLPFLRVMPAATQAQDTLVTVFGQTINSLDLHRPGTNRASYQVELCAILGDTA